METNDIRIIDLTQKLVEIDLETQFLNSITSLLYAGLVEDAIDVIKDRVVELEETRRIFADELNGLEARAQVSTED